MNKYGITTATGRIICDPIPYSADRFADIITRHGGNPADITKTAPQGRVDCGPLQILPSTEITTQAPNKHGYRSHFTQWAVVEDKLQRETEWHLLPDDQIRQNLLDALTDTRRTAETAGIVMPSGVTIKTDVESQAKLGNAYTSMKNGLISSTRWKTAAGFVPVSITELEPIAQAVAQHVDRCFTAEEAVTSQIQQAADTAALLAIDLQHEFSQAFNND